MAKKPPMKPPRGPHPLTLKGEKTETRKQEAAESPAFEKAERKMGIEGKYGKAAMKGARGKKAGY